MEVRDKQLAALLETVTKAIFDDPAITSESLIAKLRDGPHGKLLERLFWESPFKRVAFLQPETARPEVEAQFADVIYRWRALPTLNREIEESADHLSEMSEADYERFATLQQEVASVGLHHEADDAGERAIETEIGTVDDAEKVLDSFGREHPRDQLTARHGLGHADPFLALWPRTGR